jgi:hypothetical protein
LQGTGRELTPQLGNRSRRALDCEGEREPEHHRGDEHYGRNHRPEQAHEERAGVDQGEQGGRGERGKADVRSVEASLNPIAAPTEEVDAHGGEHSEQERRQQRTLMPKDHDRGDQNHGGGAQLDVRPDLDRSVGAVNGDYGEDAEGQQRRRAFGYKQRGRDEKGRGKRTHRKYGETSSCVHLSHSIGTSWV